MPDPGLDLDRFKNRIVATHRLPGREARYADMPVDLQPRLKEALAREGFTRLYKHQREMYDRVRDGENVVITTGTASGKSLSFLLPLLERILEEPSARAFLLYPTKALAQDQLRGILEIIEPFGERFVEAGVYDGDTPPDERTRIRERAHLILTNPDMLNAAHLPHHGKKGFTHLFRNLRFIVIDEMHTYRGAFGAHFANLMRRLLRVCRYYGSRPQFLCSSATLANARELAETLTDRPFSLVDDDGSPAAAKTIHFWRPPVVEGDYRRGVAQEMASLLPELVRTRRRTIAFCRSRKETEVVLKETRDALKNVDGGHDDRDRIAGYRGGYTPKERREVEQGLLGGKITSVVSTNALELGIDIGGLEVVVQGGFPGTRASFWQQIGRAGRRGVDAHAVVILRAAAIDQYIGSNPEWLLGQKSEHAVVDRDNLMVQLAHIRAAAAELPLTVDDAAVFPDLGEAAAILEKAGELKMVYGAYHWTGNPHPAGDFSLRNLDGDRFKVVDRVNGKTLTEMDRPQTYHEAHVRAVYLHDGQQYLVEKLDLVNHQVIVVPVEQNFYTEPDVRTKIDVLRTISEKRVGRALVRFGDVRVDETTVGYKMLEFHNHQNLGYEELPEPLTIRKETEAMWIELPRAVLETLGLSASDYVSGMTHAVLECSRMRTMAEASDLGGSSFHAADEKSGSAVNALIVYDHHQGGMGFAAKAFDLASDVLGDALLLLEGCSCSEGCPACVGNFELEKKVVGWAVASFFADIAPPKGWRPKVSLVPPPELPRIDFSHLAERWPGLRAEWSASERPGAAILRKIARPTVRGATLVLEVDSPSLAAWLGDEANIRRMRDLLAERVTLPAEFRIVLETAAGAVDQALARSDKLRRRFDDLTR